MNPKVVIFSDCPVFGGADWVIAHVVNDEALAARFDFSLVYRGHNVFEKGLRRALKRTIPSTAVHFPDRVHAIESLENKLPKIGILALKVFFRFFDILLFPYEVVTLYRVFKAQKPALIHVNNGGYPGALGARAAAVAGNLAGCPTLMVCHNLARPRRSWELIEALIDSSVSRAVTAFSTCSVAASKALANRGMSTSVGQLPNGVPEPHVERPAAEVRTELGASPDEVVISMTAFFEPRKGHRVLVDAAKRLSSQDALAKALFVLIGDGPQRPAIEAAVHAAGLSDRFRFLGYRCDVLDLVAASDAVVLPSIASEDMPLAVLEAMALGKPVIASNLAGIVEEVVDGKTGALLPPGDVEALAAALKSIIERPDLRARQGEAGRQRYLETFTAGHLARRYGERYAEVLAR